MFRTDLLSIIRVLSTVHTAIGIFHTGYGDSLLASSVHPDLANRQIPTAVNTVLILWRRNFLLNFSTPCI